MAGAVVLTVGPAFPPVSGGDHRSWQIARAVRRLMPVTLVSVDATRDALPPAETRITVASLPTTGRIRRQRSRVEASTNAAGPAALESLIADLKPDLVILEGVGLVPFVGAGVRSLVPRMVLDMHNVESVLDATIIATKRWWRRIDPRLHAQTRRIASLERLGASLVDQVWVCSRLDAQRLDAAFSLPVHIVPNGIPNPDRLPAVLPGLRKPTEAPALLLSGHLSYRPNVVAAERLVAGILPLVRASLPRATVVLAGRTPLPRVQALANTPDVAVVPDPPDMGPILANADVAVVPLTLGGGTRLKVLEAMAFGLPVVATDLAVEGLGLEAGVHYLAGSSDGELAAAIVTISRDRSLAQRLRAAAFDLVHTRFNQSAIERAVASALR